MIVARLPSHREPARPDGCITGFAIVALAGAAFWGAVAMIADWVLS